MKNHALMLIVLSLALALALGACGSKDPVTPSDGSSTPTTVTLDFEDEILGHTYQNYLETFVTGGITVAVDSFTWSNGGKGLGWARVQNSQNAGGTGLDMWTNNVNLEFRFPYPVSAIDFKCRDFGGNCNLTVNSAFRNVADLNTLNGQMIDGVRVTITGTAGTPLVVSLVGNLTAFKVGGQEFAIDDVAYTYTP
jgi:predicted small lipoprotein YifL